MTAYVMFELVAACSCLRSLSIFLSGRVEKCHDVRPRWHEDKPLALHGTSIAVASGLVHCSSVQAEMDTSDSPLPLYSLSSQLLLNYSYALAMTYYAHPRHCQAGTVQRMASPTLCFETQTDGRTDQKGPFDLAWLTPLGTVLVVML
ncbi:hypothetical protein HRR83_008795 [Exophiala dermatitidis]|uniref:Uncharacterized protein n=1 Tax=Exophiala dermatitidis TaxID=5970 RepID=A0AAN6EKY8_EXODE|nr:hypothetical protein HRR73_009028 [Exophiala dermatitidis]KAJ4508323.1 hypothetical protein HRR74_007722 [Exophiala dermatitidis]KAJ4533461.1 hypothetical protein HRR77_008621 [Exophiala dermatitidis]KAJ4540240.1 hypothetical protein HRR76_003652 [Exophiala dermatitidis]KAJ4559101.1 hypothetical protein HRR79_008524 [Exophiala dermatitidis]